MRGCGERKQNALYLCTGLSHHGRPVEEFVIDPARPFVGKAFCAPMVLVKEGQPDDLLVWIGEEFYTTISDYIEEVKKMGVSRRIPNNFPLEGLVAFKSRMMMVHSKAITIEMPDVVWFHEGEEGVAFPRSEMCRKNGEEHVCTFDTWAWGLRESSERHIVMAQDVQTPSVRYHVSALVSQEARLFYAAGAFAAFPITHLEWVNKDGRVPERIVKKVRDTGICLEVCPE